MQVFDHQWPRAITSHRRRGSTARDRPSALSHYTQSRSTANRVYNSKARRYAEDNRIESNCTKSEAEVTNNKKLRLKYCNIDATKLTTDRHETTRGLLAIAELLVWKPMGNTSNLLWAANLSFFVNWQPSDLSVWLCRDFMFGMHSTYCLLYRIQLQHVKPRLVGSVKGALLC